MERRQVQRFPFECPIAYSGNNFAGVGTVRDLSAGGCQVKSYTPVDSGMELEVRVYTLDPYTPIKVDKASVRWVTGRDFGLQFINLDAGEQAQLQRFVSTLGETPNK